MSSNSFFPLVSKPTRKTSHTANVIDNIFTNDLDHDKLSGVFWSDISDRLPVFQITNLSLKPSDKSSIYHKRLITTQRTERFRPLLALARWECMHFPSPNELYNSLLQFLLLIYNMCFPVKVATIRENS